MKNLKRLIERGIKTKLKEVVSEPYLQTQCDTKPHVIKSVKEIREESQLYSSKDLVEFQKVEQAEPVVSRAGPFEINFPRLGEKYKWCTCGLSQRQPFCDGRHKGTAFKPLVFSIEEPVSTVYICCCKKTTTAPLCDLQTCGCQSK